MTAFYNRSPWNLIVALGVFGGVLGVVAAITSWWVLLAPFLLVALSFIWRQSVRGYSLIARGYYAAAIGRNSLRYEERERARLRSFELRLEYTEPGHSELFVPNKEVWARTVPAWAQGRRSEISARIAETWRFKDVHFKEEVADA